MLILPLESVCSMVLLLFSHRFHTLVVFSHIYTFPTNIMLTEAKQYIN